LEDPGSRDVAASSEWYLRVLGLEVAIEFTEDGELRGVALKGPERHHPDLRSGTIPNAPPPSPVSTRALGVPTRDGVHAWADHLAAIDEKHGGIVTGHQGAPSSSASTTPTA